MKKKYRVRKEKDFQNVIKTGKQIANKSFVVYFLKNKFDYNRYGIAVFKKNNNAVERNYIKRQVRAMIQQFLIQKKAKLNKNYQKDIIIIVRWNYKSFSWLENQNLLINLINKI